MSLDFIDPYAALAEIKKQGEHMWILDQIKKENGETVSMVETITPHEAQTIIERSKSFINRSINTPRVVAYAKSIKEGRWQLNGQAIVIDKQGRVIDGQHRLLACIRADTPFESVVSYNVETESFITIDKGRARTIGDNLSTMGISHPKSVACTAKLYLVYHAGLSLDTTAGSSHFAERITNEDIIKEATNNTKLRDATMFVTNRNKSVPQITPSWISLCMTVALEVNPDKAMAFFEAFFDKGADPLHPAVQAREKIKDMAFTAMKQIGSTRGLTAKVECGIVFHALKIFFYQKERKTRIVFNVAKIREDMPRLV